MTYGVEEPVARVLRNNPTADEGFFPLANKINQSVIQTVHNSTFIQSHEMRKTVSRKQTSRLV